MKNPLRLTETAVIIALAFILSFVKLMDMPFGGSITACSMLPVAVIAFRYKVPWGLFAGFVYSLLHMLMGIKNLSYAVSPAAAAAIVFLDYIAAFTVLGLAGIFRGIIKDRGAALALGCLTACLLRFVCHVISGCTVWAGVSIPSTDGLIFSVAYNAAYMIPETVITVVGAYYAGSLLTITEPQVKRVPMDKKKSIGIASSLPVVAGITAAFIMIFGMMQNEDGFDITALTGTGIYDWIGVIAAVAVGCAASAALRFAYKKKTA